MRRGDLRRTADAGTRLAGERALRHVFLPDVPSKLGEWPMAERLAVYCDSGYPASVARLLQAQGFDVANIPGSWQAWTACGLPVEQR